MISSTPLLPSAASQVTGRQDDVPPDLDQARLRARRPWEDRHERVDVRRRGRRSPDCSGAQRKRTRSRRTARADHHPSVISPRKRSSVARQRVGARPSRPEPQPRVQPRQRRGAHQFQRPSSAISEGTSSARTMKASISTASAVPTPELLDEHDLHVANAPIAMQNSSAANVTIRPVRSSPTATASRSQPAVARLLDAREQEHAVVGREPERDAEQQDRLVDRARPGESKASSPRAGRPGRSARAGRTPRSGQQVHDQRLDRQHDRAGHHEQDRAAWSTHRSQRERQRVAQRGLLVHERRRLPADRTVERRGHARTSSHGPPCGRRQRRPSGTTSIRQSRPPARARRPRADAVTSASGARSPATAPALAGARDHENGARAAGRELASSASSTTARCARSAARWRRRP